MIRSWFPISLVLLLLLALPGFVLFVGDLFGYEAEWNSRLEESWGLTHHLPIALSLGVILFAIPVLIVLLYFLKLKRKPHTVSSTFLWKKSIEDLHVNRLMQWLRQNILLLLQLLIILAIIYAILAPRLHTGAKPGKYYILLIDNSASMSATDVKPSRLEWAKTEALKEIDAATDSDSGMLIIFNSSAETRQTYTNNRALLRKAVQAIEPTNHSTRIEEALTLAESLANPTRSTENEAVRPLNAEAGKERQYASAEGVQTDVHLFSDGRFADVPAFALSNLQMTLHVPGEFDTGSADNLAIVSFDAFRDEENPNKLFTHVRVMNFRNEQAQVTVIVEEIRDNQPRFLRQQTVYVPRRVVEKPRPDDPSPQNVGKDVAGEVTVRFEINDLDTNREAILRVRLAGIEDALALDNQAWLVLGIIRKSRVLLVGEINTALQDSLESPANKAIADLTFISVAEMKSQKKYLDPARSGEFDLVIFERCAPASEEEMPRANTWFIGMPPPPWHFGGEVTDPYHVEKVQFPQVRGWSDRHGVMKGIRGWHELAIAEGFRMKSLPPKSPRLLEGGADLVLMTAFNRGSYTDLVMAFPITTEGDLWNTNWILKTSFPVFVRNLLYTLGNVRDATTEESIRPGEQKILTIGSAVKEIEVQTPTGESIKLERGTRADFVFGNTGEQGVYEARWEPNQLRRFAVNLFDSEESNIEPRNVVQIGAEKITAGEARKQPRELWRWFVLGALFFVLVEWWVYNQRVHV